MVCKLDTYSILSGVSLVQCNDAGYEIGYGSPCLYPCVDHKPMTICYNNDIFKNIFMKCKKCFERIALIILNSSQIVIFLYKCTING